jgi:hypothetical protein
LENKAKKYEILLKNAQNELKSLRERVALMEKQAIEEGINICISVNELQVTAAEENIRINNIIHDDNINSFNNSDDDIKINDDDDSGNQPTRCFTPFATNTSPIAPSFSFNDQHRLTQISCSVPMLSPLENVEDVEVNLCLCETGIDKCLTEDKPVSEKQVMVFPKEILSYPSATTISSPLCSNYPSHWELSHQQDYFSPVVSTTTNSLTAHPLIHDRRMTF